MHRIFREFEIQTGHPALVFSLVSWGCWLYRLHFFRGVRPTNECPEYDIKQFEGEDQALEIRGMQSTPSVPLLLWPGVVASEIVLLMGQREQTMCTDKWLNLNYDCYIAIVETIYRAQDYLRMFSTKCVYKSYIRGAFNKFPDFFVQAFKIVVDSWKFTMLLLYILWEDWLIFMISGSNEQLQQELEYTLLKPDYHSWWISKMQSGREDTLKNDMQ